MEATTKTKHLIEFNKMKIGDLKEISLNKNASVDFEGFYFSKGIVTKIAVEKSEFNITAVLITLFLGNVEIGRIVARSDYVIVFDCYGDAKIRKAIPFDYQNKEAETSGKDKARAV